MAFQCLKDLKDICLSLGFSSLLANWFLALSNSHLILSRFLDANTLSFNLGNFNNLANRLELIGKVLALWFFVGVMFTVFLSKSISNHRSFQASPLSQPVS